MHRYYPSGTATLAGILLLCLAAPAAAQNDRIFPVTGSPISGQIETESRNGLAVKAGGGTQNIPANNIVKIMYAGDPSNLTNGREFALDGQYDKALEELKKIDFSKIRREIITQDANFYRLKSEGMLSLTGQGDRAQAIAALGGFISKQGDSWHYYEAVRLLGELAYAEGNMDLANKSFQALYSAAAPELKIESVYLVSLLQLRNGEFDKALAGFDRIASARVSSPAVGLFVKLGKAGRVAVLGQKGDLDGAINESKPLIAELSPTDIELAARIYNARGSAYAKAGQNEAAIRAYLHTHLMFSGIPDAHVEALQALVQLWPAVGKADRANEMRQILQQSYPGWGG